MSAATYTEMAPAQRAVNIKDAFESRFGPRTVHLLDSRYDNATTRVLAKDGIIARIERYEPGEDASIILLHYAPLLGDVEQAL